MQAVADLKTAAVAAYNSRDIKQCIQLTRYAISCLEDASGDLDRTAVARELSRLRSNLAAALLEVHDYVSAAEEALAAINLDPSWHRPYLRLCLALSSMRRSSDNAAAVLRRGLQACQSPEQLQELQAALAALQHCGPASTRNDVATASQQDPTAAQRTGGDHVQLACAGNKRHRFISQGNLQLSQHAVPSCHAAPGQAVTLPAIETHHQHPIAHHPIPVTALCGFLGSGKTTLVRHILASLGSGASSRVGLLVNDLAALNVDSQLLAMPPPLPPLPPPPPTLAKAPPHLPAAKALPPAPRLPYPPSPLAPAAEARAAAGSGASIPVQQQAPLPHLFPPASAPPEVVELSNGCICCNLRGELKQQLKRLAATTSDIAGLQDNEVRPAELKQSEPPPHQPPQRPPTTMTRPQHEPESAGQTQLPPPPQQQEQPVQPQQQQPLQPPPALEHIVVECTGVGEPAALAAAIRELEGEGEEPGQGRPLLRLSRLVTVVDVSAFARLLLPRRRLGTTKQDTKPETEAEAEAGMGGGLCTSGLGAAGQAATGATCSAVRSRNGNADGVGSSGGGTADSGAGGGAAVRQPLSHLLVRQVEAADVVLLNKCDKLLKQVGEEKQQVERARRLKRGRQEATGEQPQLRGQQPQEQQQAEVQAAAQRALQRVVAAVRALNPTALILPCEHCRVPLGAVLGPAPAGAAAAGAPAGAAELPAGAAVGGCDRGTAAAAAVATVAAETTIGPGVTAAAAAASDGRNRAGAAVMVAATPTAAAPSAAAADEPGSRDGKASGEEGGRAGLQDNNDSSGSGHVVRDGGEEEGKAHEEAEYGIGSYVFRSRRPFHPGRMWAVLQGLAEAAAEEEGEGAVACAAAEEEGEEAADRHEGAAEDATRAGRAASAMDLDAKLGGSEAAAEPLVSSPEAGTSRLPYKPPTLLRAKGLFWVASLAQAIWEVSLAGGELEVAAVGRWLCTMVDPEHWPTGRRPASRPTGQSQQQVDEGRRRPMGQRQLDEGQLQGVERQRSCGDGAVDEQGCGGRQGGAAEAVSGAASTRWSAGLGKGGEKVEERNLSDDGSGDGGSDGEGEGERRWHPVWGDRRNGLVFIGVGLTGAGAMEGMAIDEGLGMGAEGAEEQEVQQSGDTGPQQRGGSAASSPAGGQGQRSRRAVEGGGSAGTSPAERLAGLLRWAQLTDAEAAQGEEVWAEWDDAAWLGLLERY